MSLHMPYMTETHHVINHDVLKKMKRGAHIVNFARAELVDSHALKTLYDSGELRGTTTSSISDQSFPNPQHQLLSLVFFRNTTSGKFSEQTTIITLSIQ